MVIGANFFFFFFLHAPQEHSTDPRDDFTSILVIYQNE